MQFINLHKQYETLKNKIDLRIAGALECGHYIGGEEAKELSDKLADYCGTEYCLTCVNGMDVLTLALRCFNIQNGGIKLYGDISKCDKLKSIGWKPIYSISYGLEKTYEIYKTLNKSVV